MFVTVNFNPVAIALGPFSIHWYALMYILGISAGLFIINRYKKNLNISYNTCLDWLNFAVFGLLIGGRLGYVIFYNLSYYLAHPLEILYVWQGGMSFHGGAIGACVGTFLFAKQNKLSIWGSFDLLVLATCPGLFLGRIGNFINSELVGRPTQGHWGFIFPSVDTIPRHPSQLYEAFAEGFILFIILWSLQHFCNLKKGYLYSFFMMGYGTLRFFIEFFREPDTHLGFLYAGLSLGQFLCLFTSLIGFFIFLYLRKSND